MQLAGQVGLIDTDDLVEPCFIMFGPRMRLCYAHMISEDCDNVRITPIELDPFRVCDTTNVGGIFLVLRFWRNFIRHGIDEGSDGFWGSFMGLVLQRLAEDTEGIHDAGVASLT